MLNISQIAKFIGPTWDPPGSYRPQMGPMLAPGTLLSRFMQYEGILCTSIVSNCDTWGGIIFLKILPTCPSPIVQGIQYGPGNTS